MEKLLITIIISSFLIWKMLGWMEQWYRKQTELLLKFEYHSDECFKYADQVIEYPDAPKSWIRRIAKVCAVVNDKGACEKFSTLFRSEKLANNDTSSPSKSELDGLPKELREAILATIYHAVLAISYNSGLRGYLLRAQFADMFEKQNDKIKSTQIVINGVKNIHPNHTDMVPA